jgi:hypothetical protein
MMGYSETTSWTLAVENVPLLEEGEKIYLYVQAFTELGLGADDIEKAQYLNVHKRGSDWSEPAILTKTI